MRKKLIEVALSPDAINKASARGQSMPPRASEHPAPLVAGRLLAVTRAVISVQMLADPSWYIDELRENDEKPEATL